MGRWQRLYSMSPVARRASRWAMQVPRAMTRLAVRPADFATAPPIVANSIPKSGTHLLRQIVAPLARRDYGTFWISMPSRDYREIAPGTIERALARVLPSELVTAHLFFDPTHHATLEHRNAAHVFIYRDPRDVVVSEADYLTRVNTWHRLHPYFRACDSAEARISLAITGLHETRVTYPDVGTRYLRYLGWLRQCGVLSIRYEDLVGDRRDATVRAIVRHVAGRAGRGEDEDALVTAALAAIDPSRSFTFRRGGAGGWRTALTAEHRDQLKAVAGRLLIELGYEADMSW